MIHVSVWRYLGQLVAERRLTIAARDGGGQQVVPARPGLAFVELAAELAKEERGVDLVLGPVDLKALEWTGYSQSMSMPSKMPDAAPLPPSVPSDGRSPSSSMSMHEPTNFRRDSAVAAAREKFVESLQPRIEMRTVSCGFAS